MKERLIKTKTRWLKQALSVFLCIAMVLGFNMGFAPQASAAGLNVGDNPKPRIDIAVNVPSDYPGTFLDFKEELTAQLIAQGLDPSEFRITDTKVSIDASSMNGWVVMDHYYSAADYNRLVPESDRTNQPYRVANDASQTKTYIKLSDWLAAGRTPSVVLDFDRHIYSWAGENATANFLFVGYGRNPLVDYAYYPATSDSTRELSFNLDTSVVNSHTLAGGGILLNCGLIDGKLYGYCLYMTNGSNIASGNPTFGIYKLNGVDPYYGHDANGTPTGAGVTTSGTGISNLYCSTAVTGTKSSSLGSASKARFTIELKRDTVTVQKQIIDANGNLGTAEDVFRDVSIPQFASSTLNGFGPIVGYQGHGCSQLTSFMYTDLTMSYEASAFDALKNVQYYEGAEYKYFINLTGSQNDPMIPNEYTADGETVNQEYRDGINRMNENEIFYVSTYDDGLIISETTTDDNGNIVHQGLSARDEEGNLHSNGKICDTGSYSDKIKDMADYIANNTDKFQQGTISSEKPLANFVIIDASADSQSYNEQIMTIHLQHLKTQHSTLDVNIKDKSRPGTLAGPDGTITNWQLKIYDPGGATAYDSKKVDSLSKIQNFTFTENSTSGRWTFELTVWDQNGNESKASQTYLVAFLDDQHPIITGENGKKNVATITLTDTGDGIDEDGITFIKDNRGSGVAAYWITDDVNATPTDNDWEYIRVTHEFVIEQEIVDTSPIVVWVMDECGNIGNKAVFQPTHVLVEDENGNPIDDYYVIDDQPIIVLPPDDDVPDPDDPDDNFSGWTTPSGDPVTPGTTPEVPDNHEIIIRPSYSKDYAKIIYLANGGSIKVGTQNSSQSEYSVVSGASILSKINDHNVLPTRTGYSFAGWKLLKSDDAANAGNSSYINNASNVEEVTTQQAIKVMNDAGETTRDTYYLVAQWTVGAYTLRFDANGGDLASARYVENVPYGTVLTSLNSGDSKKIPISGISVPTKPGYIFQGWSINQNADNNLNNRFIIASGADSTPAVVDSPVMPDHDMTIYAVWKSDTAQFVVNYDANGGSGVTSQAYMKSTATEYSKFPATRRAGYEFKGWYLKTDDTENPYGTGPYTDGQTGVALLSKTDHTFIAKWEPIDNMAYTVDYYFNTGSKNSGGTYIYSKVNTLTKTYQTRTESVVSVADADKLATIDVNGVSYWYNDAISDQTGVVTGNPSLSLKLYYDRFFTVSATQRGEGTITIADEIVKEGDVTSVTWAPADGWKVSAVTIDGVSRDDLINAGKYEYPNGFHEDHKVYVKFVESGTPGGTTPGGDTPDPTPTPTPTLPTKPPVPVDTYYTVSTSVVGTTDSSALTITPTTSVIKGGDHEVSWTVNDEKYQVVKVEVDGVDRSELGVSDVLASQTFDKLSQNHTVVVYVTALPTIGGSTTEGVYTVTVNRYGGDDKVKVSETHFVKPGDRTNVSWDASESEYSLYKLIINGEVMSFTNADKQLYTRAPFNKAINQNIVVDMYFTKDDDEVQPIVPDFTDKTQYLQVTTELIGAPEDSTITGGAVVEVGSDYTVDVTIPESGQPGTDSYTFYEVVEVQVNGSTVYTPADGEIVTPNEALDKVSGNLDITNIQQDTDIKVIVRPVTHTVTILKYGQGTVQNSKSVFHLDNYAQMFATPAEGWSTARIEVDGEVRYEYIEPVTEEPDANENDADDDQADDPVNGDEQLTTNDIPALNSPVAGDEQLTANDIPALNSPAAGEEQPVEEAPDVAGEQPDEEVPDAAEEPDEEAPAAGEEQPVEEAPAANEADEAGVQTISFTAGAQRRVIRLSSLVYEPETIDGVPAAPADENDEPDDQSGVPSAHDDEPAGPTVEEVIGDINGDQLTGIVVNHLIKVYFTQNDEEGNPTPITQEDIDATKEVLVTIVGGEGDVTSGNAIVPDGSDVHVEWTLEDPDNYEVKSVTVNGVEQSVSGNQFDLSGVTENKNVVITLGTKSVPNNDVVPPPTLRETTHEVKAVINGDGGTINGGGSVSDGGSRTVEWNINDPDKVEVKYVFVNGENRNDLLNAGKVDLSGITEDQSVVVVLAPKDQTPVNVDKDGDGDPDINIDNDGDGNPDTNVDTDDDGDPDINIDKDKDGKPEVNVDTDDDGKPDVNVDKDGDGDPDINIVDDDGDGKPDPIDPQNPPKPNVNVDTDDDGIPDVNVDDDGDGKPDVNIVDDDGDGKPDPVDPKDPNPPKPNVNVDTDGDGDPDVNIDDDGDGKPDVNIVDEDGDGKPDPVDPKDPNPPKPNVNVDTDGDGIPDVNIDDDDDGKPDVNIVDKDGDGKPDPVDPKDPNPPKPNVNVDTTGDGKPDTNVDTDGDGKPDINIVDQDHDGKPDPVDPKNPVKPNINIDTNDDGKPDVNIDINDDGKPDINIDLTGDGKPNLNVDLNGDGLPDVNIDTDGDGIADKNIDLNGDGIVDGSTTAVKTGDEDPALFVLMMLMSAAALAVILLRKKTEE